MLNKTPNFYITTQNYNDLIGNGLWSINDNPPDKWSEIKDFFGGNDTLAIFSSGNPPGNLGAFSGPVAGIDWVRIESRPKAGETPLNVYHFSVGHPDVNGYPVYGPILNSTIAPHWSNLEDVYVYFT